MLRRVSAGQCDTIGAKEGSKAFVTRMLSVFEQLQAGKIYFELPPYVTLQVWRFSNSGSSPWCELEEVPNRPLLFLYDAVRHGLRGELEQMIASEAKKEYTLLRCITEGTEYRRLYPSGTKLGASPRLFNLYQTRVLRRTDSALTSAANLATYAIKQMSPKETKRVKREESFAEAATRNRFRRFVTHMAQSGNFCFGDYIELFPYRASFADEAASWNIVRYYLHHTDEPALAPLPTISNCHDSHEVDLLKYCGGHILREYLRLGDHAAFRKNVLTRIERGQLGLRWLRHEFARSAEIRPGFTYSTWCNLVGPREEYLKSVVFCMRILWTEWLLCNEIPETTVSQFEYQSPLSDALQRALLAVFGSFVERKGLQRFHDYVLRGLRRGDLGPDWLRDHVRRIGKEAPEFASLAADGWESLMSDEEGSSRATIRLFQMQLCLANHYRERIKETGGENLND